MLFVGFYGWQSGFYKKIWPKAEVKYDAKGILILCLKSLEPSKESGIYAYDVPSKELKKIYAKEGIDFTLTNAVVNPQGNSLAFVEKNKDGASAINILDLKTKEVKSVFSQQRSDINWLKWSPDGLKLAYFFYAFRPPNETESAAKQRDKEWGVFVSDLDGNKKFITQGSNPYFISDELLAVVKNDGFWGVDLKTGEQKRLYKGLSINDAIQYDVADDLSMITWTIPSQKIFHLAALGKSSEEFILKNNRRISTVIYSLKISLDKKYIVAQRPGGLLIADTENLNAISLLELNKFLFYPGMVTDWVSSLNLN